MFSPLPILHLRLRLSLLLDCWFPYGETVGKLNVWLPSQDSEATGNSAGQSVTCQSAPTSEGETISTASCAV